MEESEYYEEAPSDGEDYYGNAPEDDSYLNGLKGQAGFFNEDTDPCALGSPYNKYPSKHRPRTSRPGGDALSIALSILFALCFLSYYCISL